MCIFLTVTEYLTVTVFRFFLFSVKLQQPMGFKDFIHCIGLPSSYSNNKIHIGNKRSYLFFCILLMLAILQFLSFSFIFFFIFLCLSSGSPIVSLFLKKRVLVLQMFVFSVSLLSVPVLTAAFALPAWFAQFFFFQDFEVGTWVAVLGISSS